MGARADGMTCIRHTLPLRRRRGDKAGIEDIVITGQRAEYEKSVLRPTLPIMMRGLSMPRWKRRMRLVPGESSENKVREVYTNVPLAMSLPQWMR